MTAELQTVKIPELTKEQLGNRDTIRENAKRLGDVVQIPLSKIVEREGFNVRVEMGDIEGLSQSLENNGQQEAGKVDVLQDGTFALVEGHRRYRAWLEVWKRTGDEPYFMAVVNSTKTTEADRLFQMFTTQDSKALEPYEVAELIKRLTNFGYQQSEIAAKIGKTPAYISQMLSFASESPVVKNAVKNGHTTITEVLKIKKAIPSQQQRNDALTSKIAEISQNSATKNKTIKAADIAPTIVNEKRKQKADKIMAAVEMEVAITASEWQGVYDAIYSNL